MKKTIKFFKKEDKWYADMPNHSLEENEMVMGSDIVLDVLSKNRKELFLDITDEDTEKPLLHFSLKQHDFDGAYYTVYGSLYNEIAETLINKYGMIDNEIWICNVTHDIFGDHPEHIYITNIS